MTQPEHSPPRHDGRPATMRSTPGAGPSSCRSDDPFGVPCARGRPETREPAGRAPATARPGRMQLRPVAPDAHNPVVSLTVCGAATNRKAHKDPRAEAPGPESRKALVLAALDVLAPLDCPVPLIRRDFRPELPGCPSALDVTAVTRITRAATVVHGRLRRIEALRPPRRGPAPILRRGSGRPGGCLGLGPCSHAKPRYPVQAGSGGNVLHGCADVCDCLSARHRPEHG